jgi:lipoprotein NlpD
MTFNRPSRYVLISMLAASALVAGCASRSERAPITSMATTPQSGAQADTYVVKPGDTLYKIAHDHDMEVSQLESLNHITDPTQLAVGTTLRLNGTVPAPKRSAAPATPAPVPVAKPVEPVVVATPPKASDAAEITWGWPASGKIIQGFNANTKGIDIQGNIGDPVLAAASGEVMYAGNGVRGLGNLILIKHGKGFITAYAHNKQLLVKSGQRVGKGTKIATIGQTDTTSPRLHFEIRRHGKPVNPLAYLPHR